MTYQEYKKNKQQAVNELPIFFAFSNEQFEKEMNKRGLTVNDTDKIYKLPGNLGGFYLRKDAQIIKDFFMKKDELEDLMKDHDFAVSAFKYEMDNHEYAINTYQGDWEVVGVFSQKPLEFADDKNYKDYLIEADMEDLIPWYQEARTLHYKDAEEWF